MTTTNAQTAWDRMNDNERFGVKFGLLPSWVEEFDWTHEDTTDLMKLA